MIFYFSGVVGKVWDIDKEQVEGFILKHDIAWVNVSMRNAKPMKVRQAVFCNEQHIFEGSDLDTTDENAIFLVARPLIIGTEGETNGALLGPVVGTVRIHRLESQDGKREWQGSRLAVDAAFRRVGVIGAALIKLAVRTANTEGCDRFIATVQERNVTFFRRLHWNTVREIELHGRLHHLMEADLPHYPAFGTGEARRISVNRGA